MRPGARNVRGGLAALCLLVLPLVMPCRAADGIAADTVSTAPSNSTPTTGSSSAPASAPAGSDTSANGATAAEDIRDIRGPKYGLPLWIIAAAFAAVALLALAIYGIWRWRRQRRRPRVLLPFELALQQLDDIRPLMQPASAREFSIAVSDIVRGYIERRFDVIATHRTTEEFLHDLLQTANPSLARHRALLAEFLQQCDLVKFCGESLSMHSIESLFDSARGFVLETAKPDPVIAPQGTHDSLPAT